MKPSKRIVHGDDLLYEFFQNVLAEESEAFAKVPQRLLATMGVWLPLDVYYHWPVMLPFVVRDPLCRGSASSGRPEQWGAPNELGYLRDDNTLVKGLARNLHVRAPRSRRISGARMGTEFVAAHIWRTPKDGTVLASRIPTLNTFVPNLVWLPGQIAKLTDREGSIVQQTAQAMSLAIYRDAPVAPHLKEVVEASWAQLPVPERDIDPIDLELHNWFAPSKGFFDLRKKRLDTVVEALHGLSKGESPVGQVVTTRYRDGLADVAPERRGELLATLETYLPPASEGSA